MNHICGNMIFKTNLYVDLTCFIVKFVGQLLHFCDVYRVCVSFPSTFKLLFFYILCCPASILFLFQEEGVSVSAGLWSLRFFYFQEKVKELKTPASLGLKQTHMMSFLMLI